MANKVDQKDMELVRVLQEDFPLSKRPYKDLGDKLGLTEDQLIEKIESLKERGMLKRMGVAIKHNHIGYEINSMLVWDIADDKVDAIGYEIAKHPSVTHCYTRNREENFPYNFYTMTHARSQEEFDKILSELKGIIGEDVPYYSLVTKSELKKTGMKYFKEDQIIENEDQTIYLSYE